MRRHQHRLRILGTLTSAFVAVALLVAVPSGASHGKPPPSGRTPLVIFPAYFFTKLKVTVHHQTVAPECPRSGSFGTSS